MRRSLDVNRLGMAASRPGIDPRTWIAIGQVLELAYTGSEGLLIVVEVTEGALCGETITSELAPALARGGALLSVPIAVGDYAVCAVAEDPNNLPSVIGFLRMADQPAPDTVNGLEVSLALLASTYVVADPKCAAELELGDVRLVATSLRLGPTPEPSQPFVRGQAFCDALSTFLTSVGAAFKTLGQVSTGPLAPLKAPFGLIEQACTQLKNELVVGRALSKSITGE